MGERFTTRRIAVTRAFTRRIAAPGTREAPRDPRRILVAHNLLLGDTLMLTPLLAKLRANHREADIALLAHPAFIPLYASRPYGVRALPFTPHEAATTLRLLGEPAFDLAFVPGDNRYAWLAAAAGARHIVAHDGDTPWTKSWFVDDAQPYPPQPATWGDMVAALAQGHDPEPFRTGDWPAPRGAPYDAPAAPYAVLHVGASTPLKQWLPERWRAVAEALEQRGLTAVWSGGRGEEGIVSACDPDKRRTSYAGRLDLAQLWHLLKGAALLVAPDTGVTHLARTTFTPTVTLYGPGSAVICGPGTFWREAPVRSVTIDPFPCRDQNILFRREIDWVRRCGRSTSECPEPKCMHAIGSEAVLAAADEIRKR
jgi:ADP-heptose:LPS heptosyltransferase